MKYKFCKRFRLHFHINTSQKIYLILLTALYFGVGLGSIIVDRSEKIADILIGYASSIHITATASTILLNDLILYFLLFCGLFLLGMSVYGYIFIPIFPFLKGFSYGFSAAFYYKVFGMKGILLCTMGIMPQLIISGACLILGAHIAFCKSLSFKKREHARSFQKNDTRQYCVCFLILFFITYLTALMDIFLTGNVIKLFC